MSNGQHEEEDHMVNVEKNNMNLQTSESLQEEQRIEIESNGPLKVRRKSLKRKISKEKLRAEDDFEMNFANVGLRIKHYDDCFNIFDARPYTQRSLSRDFLAEVDERLKKTVEGDAYEIFLLVPASVQDEETDDTLRRRLRLHYSIEYDEYKQATIQRQLWAWLFMILGFCGIGLTTYLGLLYEGYFGNWFKVAVAICEVTSWFVIWTYLERVQLIERSNILDMKRYKLKTVIRVHVKRIRG
jgi:hypothetical protein